MDKKRLLNHIVFGLLALVVVACTDEADGVSNMALRKGEVALQWLAPNMGIQHVTTRSSDPKTAAEQEINNVHVFVFDQNGNYLKPDQTGGTSDAFQGYQYVSGGKNLVLQSSMFEQTGATNAIIVAVANVPENTFGELVTGQGYPEKIRKLQDFNDFVFNLPTFTATLPEGGLPMIGVVKDVNLSSNNGGNVVLVQMKSLMARIDLDFTMEPYQSSDDRQNPSLRFDKVSVGNFPSGGTVNPQLDPDITEADGNPAAAIVTGNKEGTIKLNTLSDVSVPDFTGHILRAKEPLSLTLYMFEHARAAIELSGGYPDGIKDEEKQRYKNDRANEEAAYIQLEGIYTNHNGYKYAVTYTLYPGANAVDDFTIKHNRQYKHNITVTGITVNNMGEEALLDTRVDIDSEENPYFIEMLREREHDAHFNVTPMDVYIYKGGSVKVEIVDPDTHTWIRMEPLKRAANEAGDGKQSYFTTDLVTNTLQGNTSYTVTAQTTNNTHEERIYFYIDENVPDGINIKNGDIVPSREATLRITYTEAGDNPRTHSRDILVRQAGMLPVELKEQKQMQDGGSGEIFGYVGYTFYIEYYEEYLEHYDGKDTYTHSYNGLEWGLAGTRTTLGSANGNEYMPYGWRNTMTIMQCLRNTDEGNLKPEITLTDKPRAAAEYCYNKNKRDSEGKVTECHWFHPTIRELEAAIEKYYGTFEVFQDKWYWSSNPGSWGKNYGNGDSGFITWTGEHNDYARATKILYKNSKFIHAESEANKPYAKQSNGTWDTPYTGTISINEGEGGYARRNKVFRIRAAYIYKTPKGNEEYDSYPPSIDNPY